MPVSDDDKRAAPVRIDPTRAAQAIELCWNHTWPVVPSVAQWQRCYAQLQSVPYDDGRCVSVCVRKASALLRYPVVLAGAYALSPAAAVRCAPGDLLLEMAAIHAPRATGRSVVEPVWRVVGTDLPDYERFTLAEMAVAGVAQHGNGAFKDYAEEALGRAYEAVLDALPWLNLDQAFDYVEATLVQGVKPRPVAVRRVLEAGVRLDTPRSARADSRSLAQILPEMAGGTVGESARCWMHALLACSLQPSGSCAPARDSVPRL